MEYTDFIKLSHDALLAQFNGDEKKMNVYLLTQNEQVITTEITHKIDEGET